jgi:hypothetical protein
MLERLLLAAIMGTPLTVMAVTVPGRASATIAQPVTVAQASPIHFGTLVDTTGAGGTIVLDADDGVTPEAGSGLRGGGVPTAGSFNVTTAPHVHYTVAFAPARFEVIRLGGAEIMDVQVRCLGSSNDPPNRHGIHAGLAGQAEGAGLGSFRIQAILKVGAGQAHGDYTGACHITVLYQ